MDNIHIQENDNDCTTDVFDEFFKKISTNEIPPEFSKILIDDFWNLI